MHIQPACFNAKNLSAKKLLKILLLKFKKVLILSFLRSLEKKLGRFVYGCDFVEVFGQCPSSETHKDGRLGLDKFG